jgi:hypothetical protein
MRIPMDLLEENGGDPPEGESQEAAAAGAAGGPALEAAAAGAAGGQSLVTAAVTAGDELPEQATEALGELPPQLGTVNSSFFITALCLGSWIRRIRVIVETRNGAMEGLGRNGG